MTGTIKCSHHISPILSKESGTQNTDTVSLLYGQNLSFFVGVVRIAFFTYEADMKTARMNGIRALHVYRSLLS